MNFSQDYTDLRCIHILLVGVELLSKARLEYYKDLLSSNNSITLANINFSRETSEAINSMLSLNPEDEMMYKFHTTEIGVSNFPLQTHKTFLGVYGIGENVENVLSAYKYVKEIAKNFQNLIEWRLFCFEPRLEDNIFESKAPKLILFHPNIPVEKLVMNIGIVLQDLSSMILSGIVNNLIEYMGKECILMQGETDISKMKRRKQGRFNKILGDALFLLGNLQEAQKKYEDSLDKHKNQGDWIWMGATYESLACISCYKNDYEQAFARFSEAENNYSKVRNGKLNIECQFKFARFIVQTGKKVKAVKKLARLLDFHLEGIDLNDKMLISKNLGLFCKQIGFERKAGFFMKLAASGCVDIEEFNEAHELLKMSAEAYQVTEEKFTMNEKTKEFDRSLYIVRENLKPWMRGDYTGWRNLQKITLEHLKAIAKKLGDTDSSVKYTWNLLLNSITDPDFQDQLRIELEQDAIHVQSNMNFRSPVQLISLVPIENKLEVDILVPGDIFLHNPWVKKKLNWIKGSVHSVLAVMQHKLSFDLHIEHTKLIIEGEAECIPTEKKLPPKAKETFEYYVVPKSHGKIKIKGIQLQTLGLTSYIYITPIEMDIMQSLPELDIKLQVPDSPQTDPPKVVMLSSEQLIINLFIKNISNEPLGRFSIGSDPDVATFNQLDISYLQSLEKNTEYTMPILLNAFFKTTDVKFLITYSNSEGEISLNTVIKLRMEVNEGIEITESRIEPFFDYPWYKSLRDVNPSMSEKYNAFKNRLDDFGFNDSPFCCVKFKLYNQSKDSLAVKAQTKDANESVEVVIAPKIDTTIQLLLNRMASPTVEKLNQSIFLEWSSFTNTRRGNLSNFKFSDNDLKFVNEPRVCISTTFEPEGSFTCANITVDSQYSLRGSFLYCYPLKILKEGIKIIPHDLILSGCLSMAINDTPNPYKIKYIKVGEGDFAFVLGIGTKNSIFCWSHKLWNLSN